MPEKLDSNLMEKSFLRKKNLSKENPKTGFPAVFQVLLAELLK